MILRFTPTCCGALSLLWLGACLEPLDNREQLYSSEILPPNAPVPELEADPAAAKKLASNAGLSNPIKLHTGYFDGSEVKYWDFGELDSTTVRPMYIFRRRGDEQIDLSQPSLIDAIPGDSAYTPLRQIYVVYVNPEKYQGEQIPSIRALEDASELGLVTSPVQTDYFTNCLVAPSTVRLQSEDDGQSLEPEVAYYRGHVVHQFCAGDLVSKVGAIMLKDRSFKPGNAYVLRRQNDDEVLDEELLDADFNEDGDRLDTNTIFDDDVGSETYSGIWRSYEVVVGRDFTLGKATRESDLFERTGDKLTAKDSVIEFHDRGVFLNRPIKWMGPSQ